MKKKLPLRELNDQLLKSGIKDPIIKISDENILISPVYWTFTFAPNVLLLIIVLIFLPLKTVDSKIMAYFILAILIFLFNILSYLTYCKTLKFNLPTRNLEVRSNFFLTLFSKKINIDFKEIATFTFNSNNFLGAKERQILFIKKKDGNQIKTLSVKTKVNAAQLVEYLNSMTR